MATGSFLGISDNKAYGGCGDEDGPRPFQSLDSKSTRKRKRYQHLILISADKAEKEKTAFCFSTSNVSHSGLATPPVGGVWLMKPLTCLLLD